MTFDYTQKPNLNGILQSDMQVLENLLSIAQIKQGLHLNTYNNTLEYDKEYLATLVKIVRLLKQYHRFSLKNLVLLFYKYNILSGGKRQITPVAMKYFYKRHLKCLVRYY